MEGDKLIHLSAKSFSFLIWEFHVERMCKLTGSGVSSQGLEAGDW